MVQRFEDLDCWQLANQLKIGIYALIARAHAESDRSFCDQLRKSAASAPANLSEAFGWFRHGAAARHARIARASLFETRNHLGDGIDRRYWTVQDAERLMQLTKRAIGATTQWLKYLEGSEAPEWSDE